MSLLTLLSARRRLTGGKGRGQRSNQSIARLTRALTHRPTGARAAFRHTAFTVIWTATVVSNVGTWMYNAASGWLMVSLDANALVVSLVQVATSLPMFLFALPAGTLADIVDKLVPELQERGVYRTEYEGSTLREHLGLPTA